MEEEEEEGEEEGPSPNKARTYEAIALIIGGKWEYRDILWT